MRIDHVYIEDFKNLKKFEIDFDEKELNTILLGQNAVGKSNFIEALVLIFRELDFEKPTDFNYSLKYECRGRNIEIECINKKYIFKINSEPITKTAFDKDKNKYLPKNIFTYYSGLSDRMDKLFWKHQNNFYKKIIKKNFDNTKIDELRRLFYVKQIHSFFVLLAFYSLDKTENESVDFLRKYFGIEDIESILFVIKRPSWYIEEKHKTSKFFGAEGLVKNFLSTLWDYSLAPIYHTETIYPDFRSKGIAEHQLYLYLSDKEKLKQFANKYFQNNDEIPNNTFLFKAMESTYISELLSEVKVKVKKNIDGKITFKELSEGEQQLLTVLGLLIFNRDEESLILLDEPDTHLNPLWKWQYLDLIKNIFKKDEKTGGEDTSTQLIINSHDPLVVGGLDKKQVIIFKRENDKTITFHPSISPKEMSVDKILTSELFGIPSIMSKELEDALNAKRFLQTKIINGSITDDEKIKFFELKDYLDNINFYDTFIDSRFEQFVKLTSEHEEFSKRNYTDEEKENLNLIAREILNEILNSEEK